jgi:hypothetical protein
VSSILDALEKLETTGGPQPAGGGGTGGGRGPWLALGVVAVAGAVGISFVLGRRTSTAPVVVAAVSTTMPAPTVPATTATSLAPTSTTSPRGAEGPTSAPTAVAAAPVPAPTMDDRERPWGEAKEPEAPVPAASPPATSPPVLAVARVAPAPPPPRTPPPPAVEAPAPPPAGKLPPGAPHLRVSFLVYSKVPERRSVALTIADGGLTTLREGEEASGIEVVHIHPDKVELRWQGETFTLEVRS